MNRQWKIAGVAAVVILLGSAAGMSTVIRAAGFHLNKTPIYPAKNRQLAAIPSETPSWVQRGSDTIETPEVVEVLGTENYLTRTYVQKKPADGERPIALHFHAAYYTGMIDTVPHVPERCFVGGGLQQASASRPVDLTLEGRSWRADSGVEAEFAGLQGQIYTVRLSNDPDYTDAPGIRVRLPREIGPENPIRMRCSEFLFPDGTGYYAGYFFIANGGTAPNANDVRTLAFNLTDDYAYYLKVQVNSASVGSIEELAAAASSLLDELIGEIMRCVPDWVEVERGNYPQSEG